MIAYKDVQDWSFYSAAGKWTYWDCTECKTIYLDPRPTEDTINMAYARYYTHGCDNNFTFLMEALKNIIKNECFYQWVGVDLKPRLHLPAIAVPLLQYMHNYISIPFEYRELNEMPKGYLLDIGCGSGKLLSLARQLGWKTLGIEIDPKASEASRSKGLNIIQGSFNIIDNYKDTFDCIICSHVMEHVHYPNELLMKIKKALKPGGKLLLSSPNSTSKYRYHFSENWRGLEVPRHLSIPSALNLKDKLQNIGFVVEIKNIDECDTIAESLQIQRRSKRLKLKDKTNAILLRNKLHSFDPYSTDIIQFLCTKNILHPTNNTR